MVDGFLNGAGIGLLILVVCYIGSIFIKNKRLQDQIEKLQSEILKDETEKIHNRYDPSDPLSIDRAIEDNNKAWPGRSKNEPWGRG